MLEKKKAAGGVILPGSCCDQFSPRRSITLVRRECWFCRYADFELEREKALEVGTCRFSGKQEEAGDKKSCNLNE